MTNSAHPMLRRALVTALAGVACLAAPAAASAAPAPKLQRALDRVVAAGAPGATVLVRDGARTTRLSAGHANLATRRPIRVSDRTRIGGVTKSFVATVVLQLAAEGRLSLDDSVARRLPGVIAGGDAITVRRLLNHTSGIFSYDKDPAVLAPYMKGDFTRAFDLRRAPGIANGHGPLFAPGAELSYSNTNYVLLGMIVEAVTHDTIGAQIYRRIVVPLGLRHTSYPRTSRIAGAHVHGYLPGKQPADVTSLSPTLLGAAGAIVSNAADVARFYRALLGGRLLAPRELAEMQTIDPVATGGIADAGIRGGAWGLGLLRERFPCGLAWGHDSETPGYMAAAWNSPDGARQVVVVVNAAYDHDAPVSRAMRNVLATAYCR